MYQINIPKLKGAFRLHQRNAAKRNIEFLLTFEEWLTIWLDSGRLAERGNKRHQYVMARFGDEGPYAVGNVKIITSGENLREVPPETEARRRTKISDYQTGQVRSPKTRALMGVSKKDIPLSEEHCKSLSIAHQDKPLSEKQIAALQPYWESLRDQKRDPEIGKKISRTKKGNTHISLEQRAQISQTLTGRYPSTETLAKRSISLKAAWARRKAAKAVE